MHAPTWHPALTRRLSTATFVSFFAIAVIEFAVPFVAVATLGANAMVVAVLGVCRFAPQVVFARAATAAVNRYDQRTVMLASEVLRVLAFVLSAVALLASPVVGFAVFALANISLGFGSVLTGVAVAVLVPLAFDDEELPRVYSRLGMAESLADGGGPFFAGLALAAFDVSGTFVVAAVLAAGACLLLRTMPRTHVTEPVEAGPVRDRSSLRHGLRVNFATRPLRVLTGWALAYNLGQCTIEAMLLIAILERTSIGAAGYGLIKTGAVLCAALGAYLATRLPMALAGGWGISLFGFGAIGSYVLLGIGLYAPGALGVGFIVAGFALDELCSGVVLVLIQTFRARAISNQDRAAATAGYRAANLTAVPVGFLLGGTLGLVLSPSLTILVVGVAMLGFGLVIWTPQVRSAATT
ncbi:MFS transporter [Actinophytocola oryzae]|uniref:MFS transporter n=1 Tax=Actinophytocola oryzae TaxID=502181 RepID=A0A4R7W6P2_9PSEU|nr:MFS transporter [Actinophytocola oryzae]TDV57699.1 MFS transporter [Actinophytocola oryzae]